MVNPYSLGCIVLLAIDELLPISCQSFSCWQVLYIALIYTYMYYRFQYPVKVVSGWQVLYMALTCMCVYCSFQYPVKVVSCWQVLYRAFTYICVLQVPISCRSCLVGRFYIWHLHMYIYCRFQYPVKIVSWWQVIYGTYIHVFVL